MTNPETVADVLAEIRAFPEAAQTRALQTWADRIERAMAASVVPVATYTTGHCKNNAQPGGCQLHNLQCGYPSCDRQPVIPPAVPVESLGSDADRKPPRDGLIYDSQWVNIVNHDHAYRGWGVEEAVHHAVKATLAAVKANQIDKPTVPPAIVPDGAAYSLAEIEHACGVAVEHGDWSDFIANLYTPEART